MHSILFTLISIFIGVTAVIVFGGIITTFITTLRRGRGIHRRADELFRQTLNPGASVTPERQPQLRPPECKCTHCGASLGANTEISPSGDFKCQFCNSWSNVN